MLVEQTQMTDRSLPRFRTYRGSSLKDQLFQECEAMASYAFSSGKSVPSTVIQTMETFAESELRESEEVTKVDTEVALGEHQRRQQDREQEQERIGHNIEQLLIAHENLSQIVAPAAPRAILSQGRFFKFLGPVPLVRHMWVLALVCLALFLLINLAHEDPAVAKLANEGTPDLSLWGWDLMKYDLFQELYLLILAGLGASFAALYRVNCYIIKGTFDSKYAPSYWVRFSFGLLAGVILSELIPIPNFGDSQHLSKAALALLGGFSGSLVYRVLDRLVATVESLVCPRGDDASGYADGNKRAD